MKYLATLILCLWAVAVAVQGQTSTFTFQGRLNDSGVPANGLYDFQFWLFDTPTDNTGTQLGTQNAPGVQVTNGVFSVTVDFGAAAFNGGDRYIQVVVRPSFADPSVIPTILSPRQRLTSTPYAVRSLSAASADQLAGVDASQYVMTGDARLSDSRTPTPGSADYIQNSTSTQTASNFAISGSGRADTFDAATQFNLAGARVLSSAGTNNFFAGAGSGQANSSGANNAFFGSNAGSVNDTGTSNSFFGSASGTANTNGNFNAFFGTASGRSNVDGNNNAFFGFTSGRNNSSGFNNSFFGNAAGFGTTTGGNNTFSGFSAGTNNTTGQQNTFFGASTGATNTTGGSNTLLGYGSDTGSADLSNATAVGAQATVTQSNSLVLGSINGVNSSTADTNVGIGTTAPTTRLHVVGDGLFTGNLTVSGTISGTFGGTIQTANNALNLGGVAANQFVQTGDARLSDARTPTPGSGDYIQNTTTQQASTNFNIGGDGTAGGTLSGNVLNAAAQYNINGNRVLAAAGSNVFVGQGTTGANNTTGSGNSFFGFATGLTNSTGSLNSFFGTNAGASNNGGSNSFFGSSAGFNNTTGKLNSFFGYLTGGQNATGIGNTFVGTFAGTSTDGLTNASAIGYAAVVESNNSLVLGGISGVGGCLPVNNCADTNVGIGTTTPSARLHVVGDGLFNGNLAVTGSLSLGTINAATQYNLAGSPIITTPGTNNLFVGQSTGASITTGSANAFFGPLAGAANTSGSQNAFFGSQAGNQNSTGAGNSFFGAQAGKVNTAGLRNSFFGGNAGLNNTTGGDNAYFGVNAGTSNVSGGFNAMFGNSAGQSNTTSFNSFFGYEAGQFTTTGDSNTFFGQNSGQQNTTGAQNAFFGTQAGAFSNGSNNAFFGTVAGVHNSTGSANTMLGDRADVSVGTLTNSTAIGSRAFVSASNSLVLGSISGTNGCTVANNCADTNVGIGTTNPTARLHVVGDGLITGNLTVNGSINATFGPGNPNYIQNTTSPQSASNFNISGSGKAATLSAQFVTATTDFELGSFRILTGSDALQTTIAGIGANLVADPTGVNNSYFGYSSGTNTNDGSNNSFFGRAAGMFNVSGSGNSFFGSTAGINNTASDNSFFGFEAGSFNTSGAQNAFFGKDAGNFNTTGTDNSFFGMIAGQNTTTGGGNSFFGSGAGSRNITGTLNTFIGGLAGRNNFTGTNNTTIGLGADVLGDPLINATAIGAHAGVAANNSIVLGGIAGVNGCNFANNCTDTKVGIGITAPTAKLHVVDPTNNGLRVQTNLAGGTVASFGDKGAFQVDSTGTAGGRLHISENGNVGIGTNAPAAKLVVNGGSIFVTNPSTLIITSPNGACWGITVNDQGALSTFSVPCPQ